MNDFSFWPVEHHEITAPALADEINSLVDGGEFEAAVTYHATVPGYVETVQILFVPDICRAGLTCGRDTIWLDADSVQEAVEQLGEEAAEARADRD